MEKEIILIAAARYQDRDGILTLFPRKLQWSVQEEKSRTIDIPISEIKSKPNVAEAKFKIKCNDYNNQEITHTFILKSQSALKDLETIKAQVKVKGQGRSAAPSPAPQRSAATSPVHHKSAAPSPASGGSSPAVWNNNLQQNKNGTTTNGRNGSRKVPTAKEINLRKNLLMRDKNLADQHRILVVEEKCITEEEFWELRKNLLRDQDTRTSQQKGRSSTMPSLRPVTEEGGEAKINITPQLINEIFEEYPKVKIAYENNVPNKIISEEAFWKRYVQSKFNDRNRASATSVGNDDIFDKCWTETEDDLNQEREHGRKRLKISNLRDLSATKEDHMEIDFAPDVTMRAGQGKILSLLRRNNRHGERILETACEKSHRYKEMMTQQQEKEVYTEDIVMEDLIEEELPSTCKLEIMDQREYFASQAAEIDNDVEMVDAEQSSIKHQQSSIELLSKFRENFRSWNPNLTKSLFPKKVEYPIPNIVTKECNEMIKDKQNRVRESKPKIENLPQKIEKEINIIQLMGNEFLRHFWASATAKEKIEKNKRMMEQLKSILEKIDNVSELQPPDDNNKQGLNLPNGTTSNNNVTQKGQKSDREQRTAINGKRLKITSRAGGGSSEQISGNRLDSPRIDEWDEALIQARQILDPLRKAIIKALTHNQGMQHPTSPNTSRPNNRTSQNLQRSVVRTSSPDHHRTVSRDSKTTSSPDIHKTVSKSTSPDIQRPISRDIKQTQHNGMQRTVNREAKQVTSIKVQKSSNHDMQQSSSPDVQVQRPSNRKIKQDANMRQDTSRVKVNARGTTQVQAARPDAVNREGVPSRTTIKIPKRNIQQTASRDDRQSNGRDTHPTNHVSLKNSNVAPPRVSSGSSESSAQVSPTSKIKLSTKRKR